MHLTLPRSSRSFFASAVLALASLVHSAPSAAANQPPSISGSPLTTATVGGAYAFRPKASDPEGKTLKFSISNKPAWTSFSTSTGRLSGTPSSSVVNKTFSNIVIRVSDGTSTRSLPSFAITVKSATNGAPTISGTPSTSATVNAAYSFQPSASDPNGQALTFSIANKPSWASFSTSTGRLSGTPSSASVGSYAAIVISVSDGSNKKSLPGFTLTVRQAQLGSAALSWTAPKQNVDGTQLTNLKGYRIHYGMSSNSLNQTVEIPSPGITTALIEGLSAGTWYFALKAYNSSNLESSLSNVASKTI